MYLFLTDRGLENLLNYFISNSSQILSTDELHVDTVNNTDSGNIPNFKGTNSALIGKNISLINPKSKKASELNVIKRYLWMNSLMKSWKFNNELFLKQFEQNFSKNSQNNLKKPYVLAFELVSAMFKGMVTSINSNESKYVLFNWKNFIISRLPVILNKIRFTVPHITPGSEDTSAKQDNLEDAIYNAIKSLEDSVTNTLKNFNVDPSSIYDLRQLFVKSCICNEIIPVTSYHKIFESDTLMTEQMLNDSISKINQTSLIKDDFEKKLLQINTEFTTLEDSGLLEYINSLPSLLEFLASKQVELSGAFEQVIDHLITEKSIEKLYRLLLCVCNNLAALNLICFNLNNGPLSILHKLITFIDNEDFNVDDDVNFQETYLFFGLIILGILTILETFKINYSQLSVTNSYTIDYINKFYYRLCDNLTNVSTSSSEEDKTIISNYNGLISDWINALFDDNNEGLSDDLIKSVNVKQIYKLIPIIYQQSIIATNANKIDIKILNNGIDYLSQMFLIPCTLNIINWLLRRIWIDESNLDSLPVQVLHELIKSNMSESDELSESKLVFQIVLKISGNSIVSTLKKLRDYENSSLIKDIIQKVSNTLDPMYCENDSTFTLDNKFSLCEQFKGNVISLINKNTDNYEFINKFFSLNTGWELMRYICDEISAYQKANSGHEDTKLFINASIFIVLLETLETNDDINYWLHEIRGVCSVDTSLSSPSDKEFGLLMDYHYSSIFNNSEEESNNDYLFSGETTNSTNEIENLKHKIKRNKTFLQIVRQTKSYCNIKDQSTFIKSLKIFNDKLIEELESFSL